MQSKRSFFNKTLFRKNLTRYWPLWGGLSIAGALVPLYMALVLMTSAIHGEYIHAEDFAGTLYTSVTVFAPAFILCYAILCAMLVWNYLYSPRAVGLMHTLPVDRTCLFITNTASGLAMILIPFAVVGALLSLVALLWGFFHPLAVLNTILAVIFLAVLFFGLATLCAMLTGHTAVLPVLYLLVNFIAEILEVLVSYLVSRFIWGMVMSDTGTLMFLSPVLQIYRRFQFAWNRTDYAKDTAQLAGLGTVALYGLVGIVLLALSWLLYRKRQSERAGDVVAYHPLRPVFRYGFALMSALTLGQLLDLLWEEIFYNDVSQASLPSMMICMAIAGIVGYYIASMLLEKSLRVFRGSWKGVLAVCVGSVVLCGVVSLDLMGLEDRIPDLEEIETVSFFDNYNDISTETEEGRKLAQDILDIHQSIVNDKAYINNLRRQYYGSTSSGETEGNRKTSRYLTISYKLKDGSRLQRHYGLVFSEDRMSDETTFDGKIYAYTHSKEVRRSWVEVPENSLLMVIVHAYGLEAEGSGNGEMLYEAMLQDAEEGNLQTVYNYGGGFPWWEYENEVYQPIDIWLEILYLDDRSAVPADGEDLRYSASTSSIVVDLDSRTVHTLDALVQEGYFTSAEIQAMLDGVYQPSHN